MSPFWWLENIRYFTYFVRELSGPIIFFYSIYFLARWGFDPSLSFVDEPSFLIVSWVGLIFAIIHSLTWLYVSGKISPLPDSPSRGIFEKIVALFLVFIWLGLSYFLLSFFYTNGVTA